MSRNKPRSKRRRLKKALGVAGVSLSLAGGAAASNTGSASNNPVPRHEAVHTEDEIADVSLSTFAVFDREDAAKVRGEQLAWWWGCRGCSACRGCRGCGAPSSDPPTVRYSTVGYPTVRSPIVR